jgi:hypothetical protein
MTSAREETQPCSRTNAGKDRTARYRLGERSSLADVPRYFRSGDEDLATVTLNELEFLLDRDPPSFLRDDMELIRITLEEASRFPILRSQVDAIRRRID